MVWFDGVERELSMKQNYYLPLVFSLVLLMFFFFVPTQSSAWIATHMRKTSVKIPLELPDNASTSGWVDMSNNVWLLHMNQASWNGSAGEVVDSSGQANHAQAFGGANTESPGFLVRGGSFDGTNDYVQIGSTSMAQNASAITMMAWIKPDTISSVACTSTDNVIFGVSINNSGNCTTTSSRVSIELCASNNIRAVGRSSDAEAYSAVSTSSNPIQLSQWQHVAAVINFPADTIDIYVNGSLVQSGSAVFANSSTDNTSSACATVGSQDDASIDFFDGEIDEVALFKRALTAAEITNIYNTQLGI